MNKELVGDDVHSLHVKTNKVNDVENNMDSLHEEMISGRLYG